MKKKLERLLIQQKKINPDCVLGHKGKCKLYREIRNKRLCHDGGYMECMVYVNYFGGLNETIVDPRNL